MRSLLLVEKTGAQLQCQRTATPCGGALGLVVGNPKVESEQQHFALQWSVVFTGQMSQPGHVCVFHLMQYRPWRLITTLSNQRGFISRPSLLLL